MNCKDKCNVCQNVQIQFVLSNLNLFKISPK